MILFFSILPNPGITSHYKVVNVTVYGGQDELDYTTILRLARHVHRSKVEEYFDSIQNEIVTPNSATKLCAWE